MQILIVGLGYVGLTKAIHFAKNGHAIWGHDIDPQKVFTTGEAGNELWIKEPLLQEHYDEIRKTNLFQESLEDAVQKTKMAFVCVGTPENEDGSVKLDYVYQSMKQIGHAIAKTGTHLPYTVVLKSTVTPGTSENCIRILEMASGRVHGQSLFFAMVPEFLQEGKALAGLAFPDKIVIGHKYKHELNQVMGVYMSCLPSFHKEKVAIVPMNYVNAEFVKYANNAFLATKISFINHLANMCEDIYGADINIISKAIGTDYRIAPQFLQAGLGFGGSCFGKDVKALSMFGRPEGEHYYTLLDSVLDVNGGQRTWAVETLQEALMTHATGTGKYSVAILGLAFKPNTDDLRDAPAVDIIKALDKPKAFNIRVHDPVVGRQELYSYTNVHVSYQTEIEQVLRNTDAVIICTDWDEYKSITPDIFVKNMRTPIVIDGRRIYKPQEMLYNNIHYYGVGYGRFDATN